MSTAVPGLSKESQHDPSTIAGDFLLDDNVINSFPTGTQVLSAHKFGYSQWSLTARVDIAHPDGTPASYFLKCVVEDAGRVMMEGEFHGMSDLYKTMPELVPRPHAWGKLSTTSPETYFFLAEFIDMSHPLPDPHQLCSKLAQLHKTSESPTGQFGFHVTTCQGHRRQGVAWESNWTVFFGNLLRHVIAIDDAVNEPWPALTQLQGRLLSQVVPRLLDELTRNGRVVKPCLIHGDLWEGNTGESCSTGQVYLFDAAVMYAHNELEIGLWRCDYNKIHNTVYTETYDRHYGRSEPRHEWDDRNRLYCIYYNVLYSANHRSRGKAQRRKVFDDMEYLIDKYATFPGRHGNGPGP